MDETLAVGLSRLVAITLFPSSWSFQFAGTARPLIVGKSDFKRFTQSLYFAGFLRRAKIRKTTWLRNRAFLLVTFLNVLNGHSLAPFV